jgi:hypothetical protein
MIEYKTIEEITRNFSKLYTRMDTDRNLYNQVAFELTNWQGQPLQYVNNVTFNDARIFADKVITYVRESEMQTVVEGKDVRYLPDKETTYVEKFLDKGLYPAVDRRLGQRGFVSLKAFLSEISCLRGPLASRCLIQSGKDGFIPDIYPWDTRFVSYEWGPDGLLWASCNTTRRRDRIKAEYGVTIGAETGEVNDAYDDTWNVVFIDQEPVKTQKHNLGYVPVVVTLPPVGSMMQDADALEHTAESIYVGSRHLFKEKNRLGSILQTLNMMTFRGALQWHTRGGAQATPPDEDPRYMGGIVPTGIDEKYELVPVNDIQEAAKLFYAIVDAAIQRGTLPAIDYGNLNFPLSGSAIGLLASAKDPVQLPRLETMGTHYRDLSKMAIRQYTDKNMRLELGDGEEKHVYSVSDLKGDFELSYRFSAKAPEDDIAGYSVAAMAVEFLPQEEILRDIIKHEDPQGAIRRFKSENAERSDPALAMYRTARAMLQEAEGEKDEETKRGLQIEAEIITKTMFTLMDQRDTGAQPASVPSLAKPKRGQTPLPLGNTGSSGPRQTGQPGGI